ncbi:hypothetical protein [Streptomyces tendae]|uniref:hypothetical protein n=1 Tax=Streptomyces tendae TaxID=1932 RepID=UPI0037A9C53D
MTRHQRAEARQTVQATLQSLIPGAALAALQVEVTEKFRELGTDREHSWSGSAMDFGDRIVTALYGSGDQDEPEFFRTRTTYTNQDGYKAPERVWHFQCASVTDTPDGDLIAFGFMRRGGGGCWTPTGLAERDWLSGWYPMSTEGGDVA